MFALVRFRDDDMKVVLHINQIKNFSTKNVLDFDSAKWHQVYWQDEQQEGYFKAQVLRLFENRLLSQEHQRGCYTMAEGHIQQKKPSPQVQVSSVGCGSLPPQVEVSPRTAERVSPAAPTPEPSSPTRPQSAAEAELHVSLEDSDKNERLESSKIFSVVGIEVFLGSGVWLQKSVYEHLMQRPKDGIFVREASVRIFSTAGLFNRSVTGAASNRTKAEAKPPLDATKYEVLKVKPMDPQVLMCTYGAKTNASTVFPNDGMCDFIFFDSVYKNDRNFLADSDNFDVDLQHFLSVIPKYSKTTFGVGFAFEYRGTLTQDLTRTDPIPLEVFWKHGVFHFGILDVPVFGLKPFYMDDVFSCLKTLDAMSQRQRDSGKAAYIVLSAVPYNAGWVNYVADKMK
ncbi:hypothetical protein HPB49_015744 [Dermacentor silvarum]|uniref:Uncharacterized protein n=1 Tax=Dermacentor silvarum TaxID=543639 RepID=A0ACB8D6I9_DERSI|nr:hypothetical protein HPB49_015744 [Dermacentor silvarum]